MSDRPRRKPNAKAHRSCGLCKPWKRIGNSKSMATRAQKRDDDTETEAAQLERWRTQDPQKTLNDPEFFKYVGCKANEDQQELLKNYEEEK